MAPAHLKGENMAHAAARSVVQCLTPFFTNTYGAQLGELFYADDPIVLKHPEYFGSPKVRGSVVDAPVIVEQATAAPGEKRGK
jgi:hypothetical protein